MVNEMEKEKSISDYTKIGVLISIAVVLILLAIAEIISSI